MNKKLKKLGFVRSAIVVVLAVAMFVTSVFTVAAAIQKTTSDTEDNSVFDKIDIDEIKENIMVYKVNVNTADESKSYILNKCTVKEALEIVGEDVKASQIVYPALETMIESNTDIYVYDAKKISVTADGKTKKVLVPYGRLGEMLPKAGIKLSKSDILSVSRNTQTKDVSSVTIKRVTYKTKVENEDIPFDSKNENTDKLDLGVTKLKTEGVNGVKAVTRKYTYIDGEQSNVEVVKTETVKKPVDEITLVGTKGANVANVAGTFTDMYGNTVAYSAVHTGSGTAYTAPAGAGTATGVRAYHGGVAVNPNIIPYGSKLYVVSTDGSFVYGYCTAVDTGGALMDGSAIVDCFYDTYNECVNFGRRNVNVYVVG